MPMTLVFSILADIKLNPENSWQTDNVSPAKNANLAIDGNPETCSMTSGKSINKQRQWYTRISTEEDVRGVVFTTWTNKTGINKHV